ncbi:type VI secretion system lipoprotein TssJ [Ectothiorhodospiraceae bacterium WFHF3C12]|nr:type VI secretion system lipoprotein TssJ [Ectothiorhodospiraceae bacterium WFHF3C12]
MRTDCVIRAVLFLTAALLVAAGCASQPSTEVDAVDGRIVVGPNLNPNAEGRPSPVFLRIYQLKDPAAFNTASFGDLADADADVLGASLLSRDEFELCPLEAPASARSARVESRCQGEQLPVTLDVKGNARYLAVMAEFYDLHDPSGSWRDVAEVPEESMFGLFGSREFVVELRRATVSVRFVE